MSLRNGKVDQSRNRNFLFSRRGMSNSCYEWVGKGVMGLLSEDRWEARQYENVAAGLNFSMSCFIFFCFFLFLDKII